MSEIKGKRIVITGGTSGIGLATARLLLAGGARVLVTGRSSIEQAREQLGPSAIVLLSDAASTQDTEKLFARARSDLGGVDLLFLNAGTTAMAPLGDVSEADYDRLFALNTRGAYFAAQKFIPLMSPGSSMVFTTSVANEMGIPGVSAYAATKAALRSMVRGFAAELVGRGIRVNAVSPGPIDTPILGRVLPKEAANQARAQFGETNPMKRMGRAEEVARAVAFLAFEATYTTGAELPVDGGASQL